MTAKRPRRGTPVVIGRQPYSGRSKLTTLVPTRSVHVGMEVWWQRTWYWRGEPTIRWWHGRVEVKRGNMCIVRDGHGHEHVVGVGMLFERDT